MDCAELIIKGYTYLENDDVYSANMICLRLARLSDDRYNTIMFNRELHPDIKQLNHAVYESVSDMNEDTRKSLWTLTVDHWIAERQLTGKYVDNDKQSPMVLNYGIGEIDSELERLTKSIDDMHLPTGMDAYDTASFYDRHSASLIAVREHIHDIQTIRQRIKTRCLNYISRMEAQTESQHKTNMFLQSVQNEVHNYFAVKSDDVYGKLQKALQLIDSTDCEDQSLLLTVVRRSIHAVADHFCPPVGGLTTGKDGTSHRMGPEEYMNRLHQYLSTLFQRSSSSELMLAESEYLAAVARKLNHHASKGVHSDVSVKDAQQGLISLYMLLYNVISTLQMQHAGDDASSPNS